jgi:acetoin utilization deacetylase AcuC-like enzyme
MLLYTHPACLLHDIGGGHPENPSRLHAVLETLSAPEFSSLQKRNAPAASWEQLTRVHTPDFVTQMLSLCNVTESVELDVDTIMMPQTMTAALHAAGAGIAAVDAILAGEDRRAFCAIRPPGHHAEPAQAMGFCYLNNVAIAAAHALSTSMVDRVAIVDFDVHHGNGTQAWAEMESRVLFCSTHQMPLYPGSGRRCEVGRHNNCLNLPLAAGCGSAEFRAAFQWHILPRLDAFAPQLIFISAGFDAHQADPLGGLSLTVEDFAWVTTEIVARADRHSQGRVVSCLEGGYDPEALATCVTAHLRALMGKT